MRLVRSDALRSWTGFKESRELDPSEYVEWDQGDRLPLVFVSHQWITPTHPDPGGAQLRELQGRLPQLGGEIDLVFYDYSSLLQRPRTPDEDALFHRDLGALEDLSKAAEKVIILSEGYVDYKNRSWCFFEAIVSEAGVYFFDDQDEIRSDLEFLRFLMTDIPQITSFDFRHKLDLGEAEIVIATFQHLQACRATHPEDIPLIKEQMVAHFNGRRLSSFGRLITGLAKYFDVAFALLPTEPGSGPLACTPYFEEPGWSRLPPIQPNPMGAFINQRPQPPSVFALPADALEAVMRDPPGGFVPALRISAQGRNDMGGFLQSFQGDPNWQSYVVQPLLLGDRRERDDPFPTIDHAIHTALERRPGFAVVQDGVYFLLAED